MGAAFVAGGSMRNRMTPSEVVIVAVRSYSDPLAARGGQQATVLMSAATARRCNMDGWASVGRGAPFGGPWYQASPRRGRCRDPGARAGGVGSMRADSGDGRRSQREAVTETTNLVMPNKHVQYSFLHHHLGTRLEIRGHAVGDPLASGTFWNLFLYWND